MKKLVALVVAAFAYLAPAFAQVGMPWPGPGTVHSTGGGGGCSQATTYLAGGTFNGTHTTALTNFICGGVTDGWFSKLDTGVIIGNQSTSVAILDITGNYTPVVHGSPTFTADEGYQGTDASSTVYIDTSVVLNATTKCLPTAATPTCMLAIVIQDNLQSSGSGGSCLGYANGTHQYRIFPYYGGGLNDFFGDVASTSQGAGSSTSTSKGRFYGNRTAATTENWYTNGGSSFLTHTTATDGSPPASNIFVLATNNGAAASFGCGNYVGAYFVGGGFSTTDINNLDARLATLGAALGWP